MVEFALVLPVLLFLFAGAADLGRLFFNFVALENSVKEGALYGARYPLCDDSSSLCPNPNNVRWRVENEARTASDTALVTPSAECRNAVSGAAYPDLRDCVAGDTYVVQATIQFRPIMPLLGAIVGGTINLTSDSRAVVLNQAFDPTPGLSPTKLILATGARNAAEITANCEQPEPVGSPNYYRSSCVDVVDPIDPTNPLITAVYRAGDTINYKITVINNGGTNVTSVTMSDSIGWPTCPARPTSMAVNSTYNCSYSRTAPAVSGVGDTSTYTDTLTVDGAEILPASDSAAVTIERPPANLQVISSVHVYRNGGTGAGPFGTANSFSIWYNAQVPTPSVWYELAVINSGGRTATGVTITDSNGPLPTNVACPARPTSLAAGASWRCFYEKSFTSAGVTASTLSASSPDSPADGDDSDTSTVIVTSCTGGTNRVVPRLIGLVKATAVSTWNPTSLFTSTLSTWGGNDASVVATQTRTAFTCMAANTTMTVDR